MTATHVVRRVAEVGVQNTRVQECMNGCQATPHENRNENTVYDGGGVDGRRTRITGVTVTDRYKVQGAMIGGGSE